MSLLLLALLGDPAFALDASVGLASGAQLHTGPQALAVGLGASATFRLYLGPSVAAHAKLGFMAYGPPFAQLDVGALYRFRPEAAWRPAVGGELATTWGGKTRILDGTEGWTSPRTPLLGVRAVLRPLSFEKEAWTVSPLTLSVGGGLDAIGRTLSVGVELLAVERRI
ncbi:MAG: hypothetical protein H6739_28770 [Alphaproteobacteria bacterium]|nr:hypothetical protein [Alphaproteobacteria bacterium]